MKQDGLIKILKGVTSFDELERVVDMAEELLSLKKIEEPKKENKSEFDLGFEIPTYTQTEDSNTTAYTSEKSINNEDIPETTPTQNTV